MLNLIDQKLERSLAKLPESLTPRSGGAALDRKPRLLTPLYGAIQTSFSGTTGYLAKAGMEAGVLDGAFTLYDGTKNNLAISASGALWKSARRLRGKKSGGFKFTQRFVDLLWSQYGDHLAGTTVLNNTQIFGRGFFKRCVRWDISPTFYIDGTLSEFFYTYGALDEPSMGYDLIHRAIEMEREGYHQAKKIITMSRASAGVLMNTYGIPPERIAVVLPGANLSDTKVPPPSGHVGWKTDVFTLGFVGLFPIRKGLDKLAEAVDIMRSRGIPIRIRVIGRCPPKIAAMDGVEYLGLIDKTTDTPRFINAIREVDLGCQLSRAELLGIAMLEFLRVGVPVMATNVGGMSDVLADGGGLLVSHKITVEQLCEELSMLVQDQDKYNRLREVAIKRAQWASWDRAAAEIDDALRGVGL